MEDLRLSQDNLFSAVTNEALWLQPANKAKLSKTPIIPRRKSAADVQCTPRTVAHDFDQLPAPRTTVFGKGIAPPLPPTLGLVARQKFRQDSALHLVKSILRMIVDISGQGIVERLLDDYVPNATTTSDIPEDRPLTASIDSPDNDSDGNSPEEKARQVSSFYLLRKVLPVLVPGLEELMRQSVHTAESRRLGSGRRPIQPLDWLGMYLMRHNPNAGYKKTKTKNVLGDLLLDLTRSALDDMMMARKAKQRSQMWEIQGTASLQEIWDKICPAGETEIVQEHLTGSIKEVSAMIGFGTRALDAEELFSLMDVDESGSVSMVEFNEAMTDLLKTGERINQEQLSGTQQREELQGWGYRAAEKKLSTRTERHHVGAKQLFQRYADKLDSEEQDHIGLVGVLKSIKEIREVLYGDSCEELRHTELVLELDRDSRLSFQDFENIIASEIDLASRKFDKNAQQRARELAEKHAKQDREGHEALMQQIDQLDEKGTSAAAGIRRAQGIYSKAKRGNMMITKVIDRVRSLVAKANEFDLEQLDQSSNRIIQLLKSAKVKSEVIQSHVGPKAKAAETQLRAAIELKRQSSEMLGELKQVAGSQFEPSESQVLACTSLAESLVPNVEAAVASTTEYHRAVVGEVELATSIGNLAGELANMISKKQRILEILRTADGNKSTSQDPERAKLVYTIREMCTTSVLQVVEFVKDISNNSWDDLTATRNLIEPAQQICASIDVVGCQELFESIEEFDAKQSTLKQDESAALETSSISSVSSRSSAESSRSCNRANVNDPTSEEPETVGNTTDAMENNKPEEVTTKSGLTGEGKKAPKPKKQRKQRPINQTIKKGAVSSAAKSSNLDNLLELLKDGADPNEKDRNGSTPLVHLAWPGNLEGTQMLLAFGADPLLANLRCNTAVHFAFERGHEELVKLLVCNGGAPALKMKNSLGKTPGKLNKAMAYMDNWKPTAADEEEYATSEKDYY